MGKVFYIIAISLLFIGHIRAQAWTELGGPNSLFANKTIFCLYSDATGNIYAAGNFTNAAGKKYVAKYDGKNWSELGGLNSLAANAYIACICGDTSGNIYVGGQFTDSNGISYVAKYDGKAWTSLGGVNRLGARSQTNPAYGIETTSLIVSICSDIAGNIYAAGRFLNSSDKYYVAKYNGTAWGQLGSLAVDQQITKLCCDASGNIYATGGFKNSAGKYYIARYNGTNWSELGGLNTLAANNSVSDICIDAAGNVYAAGMFTNQFGKHYLAKFNGKGWSDLGCFNGSAAKSINSEGLVASGIGSICCDASGTVYATGGFINPSVSDKDKPLSWASGQFYVAKYNGTAWVELGGPIGLAANAEINRICRGPSGAVYAAGWFTNASKTYYVAKCVDHK